MSLSQLVSRVDAAVGDEDGFHVLPHSHSLVDIWRRKHVNVGQTLWIKPDGSTFSKIDL